MSDISFDVSVIAPPTALFRGQGGAVVQKHQGAAMETAVTRVRTAIIPHTPINLGLLRGGVQTSVTVSSDGVTGRVFNPLTYAAPMETGTKAFFPPVAPLTFWVQRKLGVPPEQARSVAFAVARSIAKKGIKARRMFELGLGEVRAAVATDFERARDRIVAELGAKA